MSSGTLNIVSEIISTVLPDFSVKMICKIQDRAEQQRPYCALF